MEFRPTLKEALEIMHRSKYRPLPPKVSGIVRNYFASEARKRFIHFGVMDLPPSGVQILNGCGTLISQGFERLVVGDYGAYLEFSTEQVVRESLKSKYPGKPNRPIKHYWLETRDALRTKVYYQVGTVQYADYKIGMLYVNPNDVVLKEKDI